MKRSHLGLFVIMVLVCGMIASPISINAQTYQQTVSTDAGTLRVGVSTDPASPKSGEQSKLKIDFLNPQTNQIQEHIDYTVLVTNNGNSVFGPIPLTHTSLGTATIPIEFKEGENKVVIDIQGILFRPIPSEKAAFSIIIGDKPAATQPKEEPKVAEKPTGQEQTDKPKPTSPKELAPEIKDKNANSKSNEDKTSKDAKYAETTKITKEKQDKKDAKKDKKKPGKPQYGDIKKKLEDKKKEIKKKYVKSAKSD